MKNPGWMYVAALAASQCVACDLDSTGSNTGGLGKLDTVASHCPVGTTIVLSDWVSTQVALSDTAGETLSESFISTASSETSGLAFALSGDVVLPSSAPLSGRVVLLDRFGTNVVTWLDPETADVVGQLAVGTGFESNPSDYVEIDGRSAWLSRYGQNVDAGREAFDDGGDILIIDTENYEITGSIVLAPEDELPPCPAGMTRIGDQMVVALERVSADYSRWGESRLVGLSIEEQSVSWQLELSGLKNCGSPVPFAEGSRWLVPCAGVMTFDGTIEDVSQSALVILDSSVSPPEELDRIPAMEIAGELIQGDVAFATESVVLLKTNTAYAGPTNSRWISYDLDSGKTTTLIEASPDSEGKGQGLVYGSMACSTGCADICLLADTDAGVIQRVRVSTSGELELLDPVVVEDSVGLPPAGLAYR